MATALKRPGPVQHADLPLARRLEGEEARIGALYAETQARLRPRSAATSEPLAGGRAVYAGVGSPLTQAIGLGLNDPVVPAELDRAEAFYGSRGVPVQVEVCPLADPSLLELLGRRGYGVTEFNNVLVRGVARDEALPPAPREVEVREVGAGEAEAWVRTVARGFFDPEPVPPAMLTVFATFGAMPGVTRLLALLDGAPAGGGCLAMHDGLASLFGASTVRASRGRGVHAALLLGRLARAAAEGCDLVFLGSLPGSVSQRNAERLGFRLAYTRARMVLDPRGGAEMLLHY